MFNWNVDHLLFGAKSEILQFLVVDTEWINININ